MKIKLLSLSLLSTLFFLISCETGKTSENNTESTDETPKTEEIISSDDAPKLSAADEGKVQKITTATFLQTIHNYKVNPDWKLLSPIPVVIDFYADWCKPCKMVAPIMDELAKEYQGKIHFVKVNTDEEGELARQFQINGIPAIMFCPLNSEPEMMVGAMDKDTYKKNISDKFKL